MGLAVVCRECAMDPCVGWVRDADVACLICEERLCGGHMVGHLIDVHRVAVDDWRCERTGKAEEGR